MNALLAAWVLWIQVSIGSYIGEWEPMHGFPTYEECKQNENTYWRDFVSRGGSGDQRILFQCLPDTIDPRAPKVKAK
jgi:hypothetical protein